MARKSKICIGCHSVFEGRRDAKTCSAKCRKRYQRARETYLSNQPEMSHFNRGNMSHLYEDDSQDKKDKLTVLTLAS